MLAGFFALIYASEFYFTPRGVPHSRGLAIRSYLDFEFFYFLRKYGSLKDPYGGSRSHLGERARCLSASFFILIYASEFCFTPRGVPHSRGLAIRSCLDFEFFYFLRKYGSLKDPYGGSRSHLGERSRCLSASFFVLIYASEFCFTPRGVPHSRGLAIRSCLDFEFFYFLRKYGSLKDPYGGSRSHLG